MLIYKKSQVARIPIVLKTTGGLPDSGVAAGGVTFSIVKSNGAAFPITVTAGAWSELTGAWASQGYYNLLVSASFLDVTGVFQYCAYKSGDAPYFGVIHVYDSDEKDVLNVLGVPTSTIAGDISNISGTGGGFTTTDRGMLTATFNKTANLPADPASNAYVSGVVSSSFFEIKGSGWIAAEDTLHAIGSGVANFSSSAGGFTSGDRADLTAIKAKTDGLPADPVSQTYVTSVSQSLANTINAGNTMLSGAVSSSQNAVMSRLGVPIGASVSADVASAAALAGAASTNAFNAYSAANIASSYSQDVITLLGTPLYGTVSTDVSATLSASRAAAAAGGFSGSITASVDLTPVMTKVNQVIALLGRPVSTLSQDVLEVARVVKSTSQTR